MHPTDKKKETREQPPPPKQSITSRGELTIRRAQESDWPRILKILATVNYHRIGGREMPDFPLEDCFVAECQNRVIGVAGYRILDVHTAKTTLMAVDATFRGVGAGRALQQARMDYLRGCGVRQLYTNCDDDRVIDWYQRHFGYRPTGDRIPKVEPFGLQDRNEWITLVTDL